MAMSGRGGTGVRSEINITPLVDVVLVLLIIFMVVTPLLQMGYDVTIPPKVESAVPVPPADQLVVSLDARGRILLNRRQVTAQELPNRLTKALAGRRSPVVFFAAHGDLAWGDVAPVLDLCRDSGAQLGMVFEDLATEGG